MRKICLLLAGMLGILNIVGFVTPAGACQALGQPCGVLDLCCEGFYCTAAINGVCAQYPGTCVLSGKGCVTDIDCRTSNVNDSCYLPGSCTVLSCTACTSTGWMPYATGYEKKISGGVCSGNSCTSHGTCSGQTTSYRCAAGYYGSSTNGTSGCFPCPNGGNSAAGATLDTDCYVTAGSDGTGAYTFTQNCYYTR